MTEQEQQVAIADFCGFHDCRPAQCPLSSPWVNYEAGECKSIVPDYLHDLNAMRDAENKLNEQQQSDYFDALWHHLPCDQNNGPMEEGGDDVMTPSGFMQVHATAAQRAVALLRTIGKWKD